MLSFFTEYSFAPFFPIDHGSFVMGQVWSFCPFSFQAVVTIYEVVFFLLEKLVWMVFCVKTSLPFSERWRSLAKGRGVIGRPPISWPISTPYNWSYYTPLRTALTGFLLLTLFVSFGDGEVRINNGVVWSMFRTILETHKLKMKTSALNVLTLTLHRLKIVKFERKGKMVSDSKFQVADDRMESLGNV